MTFIGKFMNPYQFVFCSLNVWKIAFLDGNLMLFWYLKLGHDHFLLIIIIIIL
jgi:hypothetical protein